MHNMLIVLYLFGDGSNSEVADLHTLQQCIPDVILQYSLE